MLCTGVLNRQESLAANMGAKLVGPLLLKSFEKVFNYPIKVVQSSFAIEHTPISWLDVVNFARTKPAEFILAEQEPGNWSCRFWINGAQIEISEDDFRIILSGIPERMILTQPSAEDETYELDTLRLLEDRFNMLIKRADSVASKARQLNYHMKIRKAALMRRKVPEKSTALDTNAQNFSPQPFPAINAQSTQTSNDELAKRQARLLDYYLSLDQQASTQQPQPKASKVSTIGAFHAFKPEASQERRVSHPPTSSSNDNQSHYRALMAVKIEKLSRGDPIDPPCDRCRRLKYHCTKHLTACQACTKKHAKCQWSDIQEGELKPVPQVSSATLEHASPSVSNSETMLDASTTFQYTSPAASNSQPMLSAAPLLQRQHSADRHPNNPLFATESPASNIQTMRNAPSLPRRQHSADRHANNPLFATESPSASNSQSLFNTAPLPERQLPAGRPVNTSLFAPDDSYTTEGNVQQRKLLKHMASVAAAAAKRDGSK